MMNETPTSGLMSTRVAGDFRHWQRLLPLAGFLLVELILVVVAYQFFLEISCMDFSRPEICTGVRDGIGRSFALIALLILYVPARRRIFAFLWERGPAGPLLPRASLALVAAGFAVILLPLLLPAHRFEALLIPFALIWGAGLSLSVAGVLRAGGNWSNWLGALRAGGLELLVLVAVALVTPELTGILNGAWGWPFLTDLTFNATVHVLALLPGELTAERSQLALGLDDFVVLVGEPCSGLQGFALILLMMTAYLTLYRQQLRMPHALLLLPIGLLASFALNVVRIAALIWLGARVSPDLAENGFHSHAGWLLFTLLSFALIGLSLAVPQFRRDDGVHRLSPVVRQSLRRDPIAALLVPLMVFLLSGLVASTFFQVPDLAYPWRVLAMCGIVIYFMPAWREMRWRMDIVAVLSGIAVGLVWITFDHAADGSSALRAALATLSPFALVIWIGARMLGTVVLVPLIEEAAFRAYLIGELPPARNRGWTAVAALASALVFATLHSNTALAFLAGLVFAGIYLRRGRLSDAFWSHAAANLVVFAAAAWSGDWSAI